MRIEFCFVNWTNPSSESTPNQLRINSESTPNQFRINSESTDFLLIEPTLNQMRLAIEFCFVNRTNSESNANRPSFVLRIESFPNQMRIELLFDSVPISNQLISRKKNIILYSTITLAHRRANDLTTVIYHRINKQWSYRFFFFVNWTNSESIANRLLFYRINFESRPSPKGSD